MAWMSDPQAWVALATLTALEIVLGIDNIIFITILAGRVAEHQRRRARTIGLALAMISRVLLLSCLAWLSHLKAPLFSLFSHTVTARDLILFVGGMFLLAKATIEIHHNLEGATSRKTSMAAASMLSVLVQITLIDIVFSLDSVITAIGMAEHLPVMILAIVIAILVMMLSITTVAEFIEGHPTVKMLAMSFLLLVGMALVAESFGQHISKGYLYFAMGFSVFVEALNLRIREHREPVRLHPKHEQGSS